MSSMSPNSTYPLALYQHTVVTDSHAHTGAETKTEDQPRQAHLNSEIGQGDTATKPVLQ